ncbi:sulfatase family protein [Tautonia plasticadhaerens]|uniref:Choline-sulfatase n=1 Tax=Tautonia plasticadhaerens TaxID=2527974 RepID=A0A518GXB5_9BACT|nr:sulfatase [Tautonia plasticadhaerens]QDV33244.1 Choline-sulfatase [Tautonia plasticadhaerens]
MRMICRLIIVALPLILQPSASLGAEGRLDIVVFLADDLSLVDCSPFGGEDIRTPNMERLAAEGITFTRAFVSSPSCAPSRASLLTGLDPMRNGAMLNHSRPRPELQTWPDFFRALGYETVAIGKTAHYAQVTDYGFDYTSHYRYHEDDCVAAALSWLEDRNTEPGRRPLCLIVGTNWPHVPWPVETPYSLGEMTIPPVHLDLPATRQARARYAAAVSRADRDLGLIYDSASRHLGPETLFLFTSDHGAQFPFGKWNLYDYGVRTPLIVAWPGRVEPGSRTEAMVGWIDLLPTLLDAAGGSPPADLSGRSFLEVLLGTRDEHRDHIFLTHSGDGTMNRYPMRSVRTGRWKYIRNLDPDSEHHTHIDQGGGDRIGNLDWEAWEQAAKVDPAAEAIVGRYHRRPPEELYDLEADPWEQRNLAEETALAGILDSLRADLDAWMADQGDEGLATERSIQSVGARGRAAR